MSDFNERMKEYRDRRKQEALDMWIRIATDLGNGMTPRQIFDTGRYVNKYTGKPYVREHIYWICREIKKRPIKAL